MRTRIGLLAQPESMRSIVGATQREQRHGSAGNCLVSRSGAPAAIYSQPNTTPNLYCALSEPQWPKQANSHVTACKTAHVCIDASMQTCAVLHAVTWLFACLGHCGSLKAQYRLGVVLGWLYMAAGAPLLLTRQFPAEPCRCSR